MVHFIQQDKVWSHTHTHTPYHCDNFHCLDTQLSDTNQIFKSSPPLSPPLARHLISWALQHAGRNPADQWRY